ncbi:uncharacterized protein LOC135710957 [Ochlerotatus camptorhynchus]|uniref:uncharacterized protein LOC135710957 n=1 Tax=Ochlerotatus camptorhynchus TaxID=644619 RepID=UPI0031CF496E
MRQINLAAVLVMALILSVSISEARRIKRQQSNRNPFTTYFPPSQKFIRNRPSQFGSTNQPVRTTFLTEGFNDVTTTVRVTRPQNQQPPPLEARKPSRSREFYICLNNCLTLSHYNPVCGTDHTTYNNVYKLECANRCGARPRVQIRKPGVC